MFSVRAFFVRRTKSFCPGFWVIPVQNPVLYGDLLVPNLYIREFVSRMPMTFLLTAFFIFDRNFIYSVFFQFYIISNMDVNNQPPKSILDCVQNDGSINMESWLIYQRSIIEDFDDDDNAYDNLHGCDDSKVSKRRVRTCFRRNLNLRRRDDGSLVEVDPKQSSWYLKIYNHPILVMINSF